MSKKVIGVVWNSNPINKKTGKIIKTTETVDNGKSEEVYRCTGHYMGYDSSFDKDSKTLKLIANGKEYCDVAVEEEDGPYAFNENDDDPYIRGNDYALQKKDNN